MRWSSTSSRVRRVLRQTRSVASKTPPITQPDSHASPDVSARPPVGGEPPVRLRELYSSPGGSHEPAVIWLPVTAHTPQTRSHPTCPRFGIPNPYSLFPAF